jgi:hypothetical protein
VLATRIVDDFERAVTTSVEAYQALFDFEAVGVYEILLRRYDLLGRLPGLSDAGKARLAADRGVPYSAARERRNLGLFYPPLAQRTVGTGSCRAQVPVSAYGRALGETPPLPDAHKHYEPLRSRVIQWLRDGGVVGIQCDGGRGALALVYTRSDSPRGYDLITLYDDVLPKT